MLEIKKNLDVKIKDCEKDVLHNYTYREWLTLSFYLGCAEYWDGNIDYDSLDNEALNWHLEEDDLFWKFHKDRPAHKLPIMSDPEEERDILAHIL